MTWTQARGQFVQSPFLSPYLFRSMSDYRPTSHGICGSEVEIAPGIEGADNDSIVASLLIT